MDKRKSNTEIDRERYKSYLKIKEVCGTEQMSSGEFTKLFKENDIPSSCNYFNHMIKNKMFTRVGNNKYCFSRENLTFDQFQKIFNDARAYSQESHERNRKPKTVTQAPASNLIPINKQEKINKYIEFLKGEGYKVQKPVKVQRIVYDTVYEDC